MIHFCRSSRHDIHTHEPGYAVKQAVDEGLISAERYNSCLGMLEDD